MCGLKMDLVLSNFPSEVLSVLTSFLPYDALRQLILTNDRRLLASLYLSRGCLRVSHFVTAKNLTFPSLVKNFQTLSSLIITSRLLGTMQDSQFCPSPAQLSSLPPSLVKLQFSFPTAELCWVSNEANPLNMGTILPNLLELELNAVDSAITDTFISTLPPSLTSLFLESNRDLTDSGVEKLPTTLTRLWLPRNIKLTGAKLDRLPLHSLRISGAGPMNSSAAFVKDLPRTLEELELPLNTSIADKDLPFLPNPLKKLNLHSNSTVTGSAFSDLPPSLLALNIATIVDDSHLQKLKNPMMAIAFNNCGQLSSEALAYLPRTLTHFTAWRADLITDDAITLLPVSLKVLFLDAKQLTDACVSALPQHLVELKIQRAQLSGAFLKNLKLPALTRLELGSAKVRDNDIAYCPPGLLYLHLPLASDLTPAIFQYLPSKLKVVSILSSRGFLGYNTDSFPEPLQAFYASDCMFVRDLLSPKFSPES